MKRNLPIVLLILSAWTARANEITPAEFQQLFEAVRPKGAEKWQTIPWRTDLLEAREQAARAGKPLFMWSMNGHPLGCT